jgi:hypothetical protein
MEKDKNNHVITQDPKQGHNELVLFFFPFLIFLLFRGTTHPRRISALPGQV